jgi:hypothetical protein
VNWFSISGRTMLAATIAAALGFLAYGALLAHGLEAPWIVALLTGVAASLASRGKNLMRGLVVGTIAVWCAAAAQAHFLPIAAGEPVWLGLVHFHETVTPARLFAYLAAAVVAVGLGMRSPFAETQPR